MAKKQEKSKDYDIIIVGAGPAGLNAGVYAARQKIDALVITKDMGGQLLLTTVVENWLGIKSISGAELMKHFIDHFNHYKIPLEKEGVSEIIKKDGGFIVKTQNKEFHAKAVIMTVGRVSKKLNVPGESKFLGKGISSCVTCDAPMFNGKDVAVVGTGDTATNAVLHLSKFANKIYLVSKYDRLKGDKMKIDRIEELERKGKVEILYVSKTKEILGDKFVNAIKVEHDGKEKTIKVKGIFVEIGMLPETEIVGFVEKNEKGEIMVNNHGETSVKGFFAAGDCTNVSQKQIIVAAGEAAKAVLSASKYLESLEEE